MEQPDRKAPLNAASGHALADPSGLRSPAGPAASRCTRAPTPAFPGPVTIGARPDRGWTWAPQRSTRPGSAASAPVTSRRCRRTRCGASSSPRTRPRHSSSPGAAVAVVRRRAPRARPSPPRRRAPSAAGGAAPAAAHRRRRRRPGQRGARAARRAGRARPAGRPGPGGADAGRGCSRRMIDEHLDRPLRRRADRRRATHRRPRSPAPSPSSTATGSSR